MKRELEKLSSVFLTLFCVKVKYKEESKKDVSASLYHQLPETTETQLARELRDVYSEVRMAGSNTSPLATVW